MTDKNPKDETTNTEETSTDVAMQHLNEDHEIDKETLEEKLIKIQEEKLAEDEKHDASSTQENVNKLEQEKKSLEEICRKAQQDYINLKFDFDILQRQIQEKEKNMKVDTLIEVVKKFLPFVEDLRKSLLNIPEEQKENPISKGVQITYDKFVKTLESLNILPIDALGLVPDSNLHEPIGFLPTEDEELKGKIIQEFEKGFIYQKEGEKKIIKAAKVIIGQ